MKKLVHKAKDRGYADHGWLKSHHSFSFANFYDPDKMNFGALRVLNDDKVEKGYGFGMHPHKDMEIISIPLLGELEHEDNMGHKQVIAEGDVQVMSAGTGIVHSERNRSKSQEVHFLQIWIVPNEISVTPRYEQRSFDSASFRNSLVPLVSSDLPNTMTIHQDASISRIRMDAGSKLNYKLSGQKHGVYVFVIGGELSCLDEKITSRDALGIWETDSFELTSLSDSDVLFIEVPMDY